MFKENFIKLSTFSCWNEDSVPRQATLLKISDYFGVTVDYLLGKEDEKTPTITDDSEPFLCEERFWNHHSA